MTSSVVARSTPHAQRGPATPRRLEQDKRAGLLIVLLTLGLSLLVLAPLSIAVLRRDASTLSAGPAVVVDVVADGMQFTPSEIRVSAGASVQVNFANHDQTTPHDFQTLGQYRNTRLVLWPGDKRTTGFIATDKPGRYPFICTVRGHKEAGMIGVIVVEPTEAK